MDDALLEKLLNEDESSSLDFKLDQYPFAGATDDQKGELIKDILAFANAWRRTDAFILIGVEEVRGGRSIVHGVTNHLSEHNVQQLVNSKTNRPIDFSYRICPFEGKQMNIVQIPVQERPFYLNNKYGKLEKGVVYIRRGSSTDQASADEIARMGAANVSARQLPTLDLQFADIETWQGIGNDLQIDSTVLRLPERSEIPKAPLEKSGLFGASSAFRSVNSNYYREYAECFFIRYLTRPAGFVLNNTGPTLLTNARLRLRFPSIAGLRLLTEEQLPEEPMYEHSAFMFTPEVSGSFTPETIEIVERGDVYEVEIDFGNVQPKADASSEILYVGAEESLRHDFEGVVYADNLPEPVHVPLSLTVSIQERPMSFDDLRAAINRLEQERMRHMREEIGHEE